MLVVYMSRIAKNPIIIPKTILVSIKNNVVTLIKGNLKIKNTVHKFVIPYLLDNKIYFKINNISNRNWMYAGTSRSIINNLIIGMIYGFTKKLIIIGIGYKAYVKNNILFLHLGFSYIIKYFIPNDVYINCSDNNEIIVKGWNKELVGRVSSKIRSFRPPEKYKKGKGIRYYNEVVRIKEHKKKIK